MGKRMTGEDRLLHEPRNFTRQETHTRITLHSSLNSTGEGYRQKFANVRGDPIRAYVKKT